MCIHDKYFLRCLFQIFLKIKFYFILKNKLYTLYLKWNHVFLTNVAHLRFTYNNKLQHPYELYILLIIALDYFIGSSYYLCGESEIAFIFSRIITVLKLIIINLKQYPSPTYGHKDEENEINCRQIFDVNFKVAFLLRPDITLNMSCSLICTLKY